MKPVTLCLLRDGDRILLGLKKRGFGEGKWNGFGGKVEAGETIEAATVREVAEEAGVTIEEAHLTKVGLFDFLFLDKPEWNLQAHVFLASVWRGEPVESAEMKPAWYALDEIPYPEMWVDDPLWLPRILAGERLQGVVHFSNEGAVIHASAFTPVPDGEKLP